MVGKNFFEQIYRKYNREKFLYSDPLQFVKKFKNKNDIEIAALISSSLAYGNVKQIIKSLENIFYVIKTPYSYINLSSDKKIKNDFKNFKHRFTDGTELSNLILNIKRIYQKNRYLEDAFLKNIRKDESYIYYPMIAFLKDFLFHKTPTLIPHPDKKSAFKRFNLFLRWLVRRDEIDTGIWTKINPSLLIIPLDTHMLRISQELKITSRKDNSIKTAIEITDFFKKINPKDPVKYDFALTRAPILKRFK